MKAILFSGLLLAGSAALVAQSKSCCVRSSSATEAFAQLGEDAAFRTSHFEPLPFTLVQEAGQWISFKTPDGKEGRAYQISPEKKGNLVVFVIHEWWGLNDYIRREAEKLQKELGNVTVLALDLYDKKIATTREEAAKFMGEVKEERARAVIQGALEYVGPEAKIGTIGWCFGGGWSLQASLMAGKQGVACVMYYGMPESDTTLLKGLSAPVLGIFASKDGWITPAVMETFEKNMTSAGKSLTVKSYDADHAFANPSNPQYDKAATEDAWKHVVSFFKTHLR